MQNPTTMKKNIIILSLLIPFSGYCQNLVNNSSFESFNTCPPQIGLGFTTYISYADNWDYYQLTPDYFNSCSAGNASVPNNYLGTQTASTGIAYAGFSAFQDIFVNNAREGILVKLSDTLQVGVKYYCSFKINLADSSVWACNKVGMLFHTKYTQECNPPYFRTAFITTN